METMVIQLVIEIFGFATYNYTIIVMGKFHPPAFIEPFSLFLVAMYYNGHTRYYYCSKSPLTF